MYIYIYTYTYIHILYTYIHKAEHLFMAAVLHAPGYNYFSPFNPSASPPVYLLLHQFILVLDKRIYN